MEPDAPPVERVPVAASTQPSRTNHTAGVLRNLDLLVLLLALPAFILVDAPIAGYLAAGGADRRPAWIGTPPGARDGAAAATAPPRSRDRLGTMGASG